jgi:hypothetical protein
MRGEPQAWTLASLQATVNPCPISLRPKIKPLLKRPPQRGAATTTASTAPPVQPLE